MSFTKLLPAHAETLELFGPVVEFLAPLEDEHQPFCVLRGTLPPGISVPLHSHPDIESFLVLSGVLEVLRHDDRGGEWVEARAGDYIQISEGTRHAWRNLSAQPAVQLIITSRKLGRFFRAVGRAANGALPPPTPEDLRHFAEVSAEYGYWNATPEENAAVGIDLSF